MTALSSGWSVAAIAGAIALVAAFLLLRRRRDLQSLQAEVARLRAPAAIGRALRTRLDIAMITLDAGGVIQEINPAAESLLGYSASDIIGRKPFHEIHRSPVPGTAGTSEPAPGEAPVQQEVTLRHHNGRPVPVILSSTPVSDRRGKAAGAIVIARDVAPRRAAERALRRNQRQLDELLRHAPAAIAILDRELRYVATSDRWISDFQLPEAVDLTGRSHLETFPALPTHWRESYRSCLTGTIQRCEAERFIRADGSEQWVRWECRPWLDADGSIAGIAIYAEIVTDQRRAAQRLRESETLLLEAQSLAQAGSWEFDVAQGQLRWSRETYRIHELAPDQPVKLEQAIHYYAPEYQPLIRAAFERGLAEGAPYDLELEIITATDHRRWVRTVGRFEQSGARVVRAYGIFQDISERKRWEETLLRAKDTALAAARAKSDFLANMSHEIRTPLNAVIGMAGLMAETPLTVEQREYADTIRAASDGLLDLLNDVLDFSKIESDKLELERQPFVLRDCVESALDLMAKRAGDKGLELVAWIDPALPAGLVGDATRLRQVLVNLIANAVKFTREGEVYVAVEPAPAAGEERMRVTVRDTGIGIAPERMDRLFKLFSQVDSSTTRHYGGTGLGLAISRRLVELMDGTIWADSEPERGSRFYFELPITAATAEGGGESTTPLRGRRILIIDDHPTGREVLRMHVTHWGATALVLKSPLEALGLVTLGEQFDAIIVDQQMPGVDGIQFIRQLRSQFSGLEIPVVLLVPIAVQPLIEPSGGPVVLVAKPLKAVPLLSALLRHLGAERPPSKKPDTATAPPFDSKLRVLLVEDNAVNQRVASAMLTRLGLEPALATHGLEALALVERMRFDIILMDVQMPEMDGLETTREIRQRLPRDQQPVIIALTANALSGDRERCLEAGMDDYVAKPARQEELRKRLEYWRHRRPSSAVA